jgi:hypothetical protein
MTETTYLYYAVLKNPGATETTSLMAIQDSRREGLQAVGWHAVRKEWLYAPAIAASLLYDSSYENKLLETDRPTAERVAREWLGAELPSVETLDAMVAEGKAMGWQYGPPVS